MGCSARGWRAPAPPPSRRRSGRRRSGWRARRGPAARRGRAGGGSGRGRRSGAGAAFIGGPLIAVVVGAHRLAAAAAADDPLAQRGPLAWGPGPGVGPVGCKFGLVGQVVSPADVALVMLLEQRRPLVAGLFHDEG